MKIRTDFYPTTNILFWIYEHDGEYFLVDSLPHPILSVFGSYRTMIFKMRGKKITKEEGQKYRNSNYKNNGYVVSIGAGFSLFLGTQLMDGLKKIIIKINPEILMILFWISFFLILFWLKSHRRKGGYDKIEYNDVKIKISSRGSGIKNCLICHILCLATLVFVYTPYTILSDAVKASSYINLSDLSNVIVGLLFFWITSLLPALPTHSIASVIKMDKRF